MAFSPNYNIVLAPKENSFHVKYNLFSEALKNIIIVANDESGATDNYLFIKKYIESYDFSIPKLNSDGVSITTPQLLFDFLMHSFSFIYYIGESDYYSYNYPDSKKFGIPISVCLFSVYYDPSNKLRCTTYELANTKLHDSELNYCGEMKTNNKSSLWSWTADNNDSLFYTVSLWFENKIYKIYDTKETSFLLSDHSILDEGDFELIVVTKDNFGASSEPALFKFRLKTSFIIDDVSIKMIDEEGDQIDISTKANPTFRISNFNSDYDYVLNFDNTHKYSYKESVASGTALFYHNKSEGSLEFKIPENLKTGNHNLNLSIVDEISNTYGGDYLFPTGEHGSHFFFFFIANIQSEAPELVSYLWNDDGSLLISWKSDELSKSFDVFQGSTFLLNTIETVCLIEPLISKKADTVITIKPYGYDGKASNNILSVIVKKPILTVSNFNISLKDAIILDEKTYVNNPCPTFSWETVYSTESIANYMVSLDGSNWFGINTREYTFPKLKDGEYTFRLKAVFTDKTYTAAEANLFSFVLKTSLPSYPIFSKETINNTESSFDDLFFSWNEIADASYYELNFNDSSFIKKIYTTKYTPFDDIDAKNFLKVGWNTVSLTNTSKYGNTSKATKLSFLVTRDNKKTTFYNAPISFETFYALPVSLHGTKNIFTYVITDPDDVIFEEYEDGPKTFFRNSLPFLKNGVYKFDVFLDNKKVIDTFFYNFNSYAFNILQIAFDGEFVKWSIDNNDIFPFFEYSISLIGIEYKTWNTCKTNQTPNLKGLPSGEYKLFLKAYSFDGNLQETKELIGIHINGTDSFSVNEIPITGLAGFSLNILHYKKSNSFVINHVTDGTKKINCFLQYKDTEKNIYCLYDLNKKTILNTKVFYDFIINIIE